MPLHPDIEVELVGKNGNAFAIIAACRKQAKRSGLSQEDIEQFTEEATSGDYDHVLQICMKWFNVS